MRHGMGWFSGVMAGLTACMVGLLALPVAALAQPGPDGIDWVTVGDVGNPGFDRDTPVPAMLGRGSVGYDYRVGRTEVTTAQWLEFYNTFKARADPVPDSVLPSPIIWGATIDPSYTGPGTRYMLQNDPNAAMRAVSGISWRMGAMLANWLHNDKSSDITAYQNGAYDISTFGYSAPGVFTDQLTHNPGARYWIPTLDEYLKANFYDPNKNGPGQGGWWLQPNMSDIPLIYGPPGVGMANSGFTLPQSGELRIPLMSYPAIRSYYGVLDAAGFTEEWIEDWYIDGFGHTKRLSHGSYWSVSSSSLDAAWAFTGGDFPSARYSSVGFRLASAVPSPGILSACVLAALVGAARRRREVCRKSPMRDRLSLCFTVASLAGASAVANGQPAPDGIDWVTVRDVGNVGYDRDDPLNRVTGRGSVGYEYRLGRTEVTTAQWLEFYNTFKARADPVPDAVLPAPIIWGATIDPSYTGPGTRYMLQNDPNAAMRAVSGISWRMGAMLANWLHNDKSSDITAYQNGAYDISTFGYSAPGVFTDQLTHNPGARYWIPTLDEYLKANFYDANKNGPGQGGWWQQPNMSDIQLVYGPPGVGMANSGFTLPQSGELRIPLMSYPETHSYYGVLDSAGFTQEWLEDRLVVNDLTYRLFDGSYWSIGSPNIDLAYLQGSDFPSARYSRVGFRLASSVPSPGILSACVLAALVGAARRRREVRPCADCLSLSRR